MKNKYRIVKWLRHTETSYTIQRFLPKRKAWFFFTKEAEWRNCQLEYDGEVTACYDTCTVFTELDRAMEALDEIKFLEDTYHFQEVVIGGDDETDT